MNANASYAINVPLVIFEVVDNETFIIDYHTGCYFSFEAAGTWIWEKLIEAPASLDGMLKAANQTGGVARPEEKLIRNFFQDLVKNQLIVECPAVSKEGAVASAPPASSGISPKKIEWGKLKLKKFSDMSMLLRLDPVHEIDGRGWPKVNDA